MAVLLSRKISFWTIKDICSSAVCQTTAGVSSDTLEYAISFKTSFYPILSLSATSHSSLLPDVPRALLSTRLRVSGAQDRIRDGMRRDRKGVCERFPTVYQEELSGEE